MSQFSAYNRPVSSIGTVIYKDLDISMKSHPNTGDLRTKTNEEAIKQSLRNLVFTNFSERPFRPELYGGITELLFEPLTQITKLILEDRLAALITNWEPRVELISVDFPFQDLDRGSIQLSITYSIRNVSELQTLDLIIKRLR